MNENQQFRERMLTLLEQIAKDVHDMNTLAERRAKDYERQKRCRSAKQSCHVTEFCHVTKEGEGKEEKSPLTPLKGVREGEEKEKKEKNARAREVSFSVDKSITPMPRNEGEVVDYFRTKGYKSDPLHFYAVNMARGWVDANGQPIRSWWASADGWERKWLDKHPAVARAAAKIQQPKINPETGKPFTVKDWALCAERCANFNGLVCLCGATLPPDRWTRPIPPEECTKFKAKEGGAA